MSDGYHSCYVLAGLSSAQHKWHFTGTKSVQKSGLIAPYQWYAEKYVGEEQIYDEEDRVNVLHPVFVVPVGVAEQTRAYFESIGGI
jgi:protein farnesyltransferase subunit beta